LKGRSFEALEEIGRNTLDVIDLFCCLCNRCGGCHHHTECDVSEPVHCEYPLCSGGNHAIRVCPALNGQCKKCGRRGHTEGEHCHHSPVIQECVFRLFMAFGFKTCLNFSTALPRQNWFNQYSLAPYHGSSDRFKKFVVPDSV
jgi:hypothetical protein